jgi:hypothetical protein
MPNKFGLYNLTPEEQELMGDPNEDIMMDHQFSEEELQAMIDEQQMPAYGTPGDPFSAGPIGMVGAGAAGLGAWLTRRFGQKAAGAVGRRFIGKGLGRVGLPKQTLERGRGMGLFAGKKGGKRGLFGGKGKGGLLKHLWWLPLAFPDLLRAPYEGGRVLFDEMFGDPDDPYLKRDERMERMQAKEVLQAMWAEKQYDSWLEMQRLYAEERQNLRGIQMSVAERLAETKDQKELERSETLMGLVDRYNAATGAQMQTYMDILGL